MPDRTFDILVEFRSKLEGFAQLEGKMASIRRDAQQFNVAMAGFAGGIAGGAVAQLTSYLGQIPRIFEQAVMGGLQFNATLEGAQLGIAAIIKQFDETGRFKNFDAALGESAKAIELLKTKALQSPATFEQLVSAFQGVSGAASAANIPIQKQVDLVVLMSQALAGLGIRSEQILQESRALLTGNITEDAMAARILGITKAQIDSAKAQGQLFEFLTKKLSAFAEAGVRGQQSYTTQVSNLSDALTQLKGIATSELFDVIKTKLSEINAELAKPQTAESARAWGGEIAAFVKQAFAFAESTKKEVDAIGDVLGSIFGPSSIREQGRWVEFSKTQAQVMTQLRDQIGSAQTIEKEEAARSAITKRVLELVERQKTATGEMKMYLADAVFETTRLSAEFNQIKGSSEAAGYSIKSLVETLDKATAKSLAGRITQIQGWADEAKAKTAIDNELATARAQAGGSGTTDAEQRRQAVEAFRLAAVIAYGQASGDVLAKEYEGHLKVADAAKKKTNLLREESDLLRDIKARQQLISESPFLGAEEKERRMHQLLIDEQQAVTALIVKYQAYIAAHQASADPIEQEKLAQLIAKVRELGVEYELLGYKVQQSDFTGGLQKELTDWVNGFGTAAHQIAQTIEGTINAALQGTNQLLLDAVFQTGDWRQTLIGVERQILNLFLTWIEQMALQRLAEITGIGIKTTAQTTANAVTTASATPAAIAQTGASSGSNWIIGAVAAAAAIAAIVAAMSGAFARGGRTGRGPKLATVGEEGEEFVFTNRATENIGVHNLYAMMHAAERGAPRFGDTSYLSPTSYYGPNYPGVDRNYPRPGDIADAGLSLDFGGDEPVGGGPIRWVPDPVTGQPTVQVNWRGTGSVPYWNQPQRFGSMPYQPFWSMPGTAPYAYGTPPVGPVGPGTVNYGSTTPTYNSSRGTWEFFDVNDQLISFSGPPPATFNDPSAVASGSFIPGSDRNYPSFIDPATGMTIVQLPSGEFAVVRSGGRTGSGPGGGTTGGAGIRPLTPSQYYHQTFGGVTPTGYRDTRGSATFDPQAAGALQMWFQSMGGNPNTMTVGDAGRDLFRSGHGRIDPESGMISVVQAGNIAGQHSVWRDPRWVEPSQAESARLGLSFDVRKFNDWLIEHNPWFYNAIPHGAAGMRIPGPPSTTDTIMAMLATGEHVISAPATQWADRIFGRNFLEDLNDMRIPVPMRHYAMGGRVDGESADAGGGQFAGPPIVNVKVINVTDWREALREREKDPDHRTYIIDTVHGSRHELGLPSTA